MAPHPAPREIGGDRDHRRLRHWLVGGSELDILDLVEMALFQTAGDAIAHPVQDIFEAILLFRGDK